ncbi:MAG: hypothetical protein M1826_005557 [Phylliscum demangeonii]|nr:MAG: hypothetical protein M1826_005557 [Phylliscum demangeonii]
MSLTFCLMLIGLLLLCPAVLAAPTSGDDDIYAEAPDAPSLVLPAPHPSLADWREFLDGPRPGRNPESHRPVGECLAGYWTYLGRRTVRDNSRFNEARPRIEFASRAPFLTTLRDLAEGFPRKKCLKDWTTRKEMCYDKLIDKVRLKDSVRVSRFDAFWKAVSECMQRASDYQCRPGFFPVNSKSILNICTKQHRSLLPRSLLHPVPGSRFRPKWSTPLAVVASEPKAKAIAVPESAMSQPAARAQAMLHRVGTAVQALEAKSQHAMERIRKAAPALSPLLHRLAQDHGHGHAPAPAVPLNAFEH